MKIDLWSTASPHPSRGRGRDHRRVVPAVAQRRDSYNQLIFVRYVLETSPKSTIGRDAADHVKA
jgi:hypothetical protein